MALLLSAMTATVLSDEPDATLPNTIQPILAEYCADCHGETKQKGDIRFDQLDPDIVRGKDAEVWQLVLDQLNLGEMPPRKAKKRPDDDERRTLVDWLTASLKEAAEQKRKDVRVVMRRLTNAQYTNSLRDLLGLDVDFGQDLPPDGLSDDGFKNNGADQAASLLQTEYYLAIAESALRKAILTDIPPVSYRYVYRFGRGINPEPRKKDWRKPGAKEVPVPGRDHIVETFENRDVGTDASAFEVNDFKQRCYPDLRGAWNKRFQIEKDGILMRPAIAHVELGGDIWLTPMPSLKLHMRDFPTEGDFVLRVKVARADPDDDTFPYLRACMGEWLDHGEDYETLERSVKITGTRDKFQTIEFRGRLENHPIPVFDPNNKDIATMIVVGVWNDAMAQEKTEKGPALVIQSMEFECGHVGPWPPAHQERVLIASENRSDEEVYSREVIQNFMRRAFRRPVTSDEVDAYHGLWKTLRPDCATFEQSIRETLASVLCSPNFLYLVESASAEEADAESPESITEHQLASRMSYSLWNSMPDDRLSKLANEKRLREELPVEIDRMIQNPKSADFVAAFCEEWLQMEKMTHTRADAGKFPRFNRFVRDDMLRETRLFFAEVLREDMSIMTLVDADFTMLNQNLAQFYGMDSIKGGEFRKVNLAEDAKRGGLISHGLFLAGNSNGREPHPIKRGAWLISRILDDPPPPPPPNVPQIDEDDPAFGKLSIKEQLQLHRDNPSCRDCHAKVDPWGLLLENYDAVGLWKHREGAAEATLPHGKTLDGVDALKQHILVDKKEQFTRSLIQHLLRFGLGRSLSFTDRAAIDEIVKNVERDDYRIQGLLRAIITSPLFSRK